MDGGADLVNEAGQRQFPGPHAADGELSLEHENAAAGLGKDSRRREAVRPGANDNRIRLIQAITVVSCFSRTRSLSEETELEFCGIRHPVAIPRWIPDDVDLHVGDTGHLRDLSLHFTGQRLRGGTGGSGERHSNAHSG